MNKTHTKIAWKLKNSHARSSSIRFEVKMINDYCDSKKVLKYFTTGKNEITLPLTIFTNGNETLHLRISAKHDGKEFAVLPERIRIHVDQGGK